MLGVGLRDSHQELRLCRGAPRTNEQQQDARCPNPKHATAMVLHLLGYASHARRDPRKSRNVVARVPVEARGIQNIPGGEVPNHVKGRHEIWV